MDDPLAALPVDLDLRQELLAAVVTLVVLLATLPRGRRRLAIGPLVLLLLAPLPFAATFLFPNAVAGVGIALQVAKLFLVTSLLQSLLLVAAVSVWERVSAPLPRIFLDVLRFLVAGAGVVAVLYDAGVEPENLFTGSAVLTAVLGFALKDTLGNVFAGLAIHAEHPFEIGDWIQYDAVPAHVGRVVEINWRATKVLTLDEAHVIIPNGQLAQASIRNFTKPEPWSRRSLFFVTPYDVPPQRVQQIVLEAIHGSFGVLEQPAPSVVTNAFVERGVEHWVRLFTTEFDKRDRVDGMARDRIWYALARHGIEMPVATQAIRLTPLPPSAAADPAAEVGRRTARLAAIGLFAGLEPDVLRRIAAESVEAVYAAGEQVVRQGRPGDSMFVIVSGSVEVTASEGARPAARIAVLGPGDYFGEMSLLTGSARSATVTTCEQSRLVEIGKASFQRLLSSQPGLVEQFGAALDRRLDERSRTIAGAAPPVPVGPDMLRLIRDFFSV